MNYRLHSFHSALLRSGVGKKTHTYCPIDPSLEIVLCPFCPHDPFKWPIPSLHPLVSCRLYPSGSNKNFHSICKGKNWEWSLQCTASVSSGSESNHTKTVAARQRTCLSLPPVSCTVGERKKQCKQGASEEVYLRRPHQCCANELCPGLQSSRPLKQYAI